MSNTPHELPADFPEFVEKMKVLKESDPHFAKLYEAYHEVNGKIHRAETDVEPTGDDEMEAMRVERMKLKDDIFAILKK